MGRGNADRPTAQPPDEFGVRAHGSHQGPLHGYASGRRWGFQGGLQVRWQPEQERLVRPRFRPRRWLRCGFVLARVPGVRCRQRSEVTVNRLNPDPEKTQEET